MLFCTWIVFSSIIMFWRSQHVKIETVFAFLINCPALAFKLLHWVCTTAFRSAGGHLYPNLSKSCSVDFFFSSIKYSSDAYGQWKYSFIYLKNNSNNLSRVRMLSFETWPPFSYCQVETPTQDWFYYDRRWDFSFLILLLYFNDVKHFMNLLCEKCDVNTFFFL